MTSVYDVYGRKRAGHTLKTRLLAAELAGAVKI